MHSFERYMNFLAPVPRPENIDTAAVKHGEALFAEAGCVSCHTNRTFTTLEAPPSGVPGNYEFHPYSDYLLHDMGALNDHIGNEDATAAFAQMMKTAPLWGARMRPKLLHDGRASDAPSAIRAHDSQGAAAANAFEGLTEAEQQDLVAFVLSL